MLLGGGLALYCSLCLGYLVNCLQGLCLLLPEVFVVVGYSCCFVLPETLLLYVVQYVHVLGCFRGCFGFMIVRICRLGYSVVGLF